MMENNQKNPNQEEYVLEVNDLKMYFDITTGFFKTTPLKAVDGVSFKIKKGETLGVVGESGCGKTTLGRTIMNLYKASSGEVIFEGQQISSYSDLKRIKVEEKFEIKSLKYETNKKIKVFAKSANEEIKEYSESCKDDADAKEKIDTFAKAKKDSIVEYAKNCNAEFEAEKAKLQQSYSEKYNAKVTEINNAINESNAKRDAALAELTPCDKASDVEACNAADAKIQEFKASAKNDINQERNTRNQAIVEAKKKYAQSNEEYKELKAKFASDEQALRNCLKEASKEEKADLKKKYEFVVKDHNNDLIVKKEKNHGDYKIELSIIKGNYKNSTDDIKANLKENIKNTRGETKYYAYVDAKNAIIKENKDEVKRIKSSSYFRLKNFRKKCTMVFQDPYSSLNPRMTVQDIIAEPLDVNKLYNTKAERRSKVLNLMKKVGLSPEHSTRYAHEFSGGQRQRIGIARALAVNPSFIVCDEPVSALDVSIQAQVINTFKDLQDELGLTYLFIAHDLLVVRHISDRIAVMYLGRIVEIAETNELFANPLHPYTESLLSAVPMPDPETARKNERIVLEGDVPSPLNVPTGCPFRTRCPKACDKCLENAPKLVEVKPGHFASCFLLDKE